MTSARLWALIWVSLCVAGCSAPAGRWQLVKVEPPGAPFPFTQIDFGNGGAFRAKGRFTPNGQATRKEQFTTGKLNKQGGSFRLNPTGYATKGLNTYVRLDGKMVMTLRPPGRDWKVKGIFQRVTPIDPRLLDSKNPITPQSLKPPPERDQDH